MTKLFNCIQVLFIRQKKNLPGLLKKLPGGDYLRLGIFIACMAWLLQGLRYMNWHEAVIKILFDLIFTPLLWLCGVPLLPAWLIVHTLNFTLNGQLFAMFTHFGANGVSAEFFLNETLRISEKLQQCTFIEKSLAFGSLSRGEYKKTSDIDLRLVPASGQWNFWKCCFYAFKMRTSAFFRGYPLDLYVFTIKELTKKMRTDEAPVLLAGRMDGLDKIYPAIISLEKFSNLFYEKQLKGKR